MKTQINQLIRGDHRISVVGTGTFERNEIAQKVISENPEILTIKIRGIVVTLQANYSTSGKSVSYFSSIPVSLYQSFWGDFGMPKNNPEAYISINDDMTISMTTNTKKSMYKNINESEIEIL